MIRVLVAEDSLTVRELLISILRAEPDIEVIGEAKDGAEAVELAMRLRPDLITMDVHMPVMDGLAATKEIMIAAPTPILIVSGQATQRQIELSLDATRAGALMVVPKPENPQAESFPRMHKELIDAVRAMARVKVVRHWRERPRMQPPTIKGSPIRLVALAASTGGPAALQRILSELPGNLPVPVLVVQHIAPGFVNGLAEWLRTRCNLRVKVAEADEPLESRTVYLAPDDHHLGITAAGTALLSRAPQIGGFRPSATFLFESAAKHLGAHTLAVMLTGMGRDGVAGLRTLHAAGGRVVAQDEDSSIVFGMPGEAIRAGVAHEVLPLSDIAARVHQIVSGNHNE